MRVVAHLISVLLLVPGIVIAAVLLALGHVSGRESLGQFILAILDLLLAFLPLAALTVALWLGLALMGFSRRLRRFAAIGIGAVALATAAVMLDYGAPWHGVDDAGIFLPQACALVLAVWLGWTDEPDAMRGPVAGSVAGSVAAPSSVAAATGTPQPPSQGVAAAQPPSQGVTVVAPADTGTQSPSDRQIPPVQSS